MENLEILIKREDKEDFKKYYFTNDAYSNASYFSKLSYFWAYKIIQLSKLTQVKNEHLGKLEDENLVENFTSKFSNLWYNQGYKNIKSFPLFKTLLMSNLDLIKETLFFNVISMIFELADVFLFRKYIQVFEKGDTSFIYQFQIGLTFITVKILGMFLKNKVKFLEFYLSDRPLIQLNHLILTKVLKESPANTKSKYSQGHLVNLIASDSDKVKFVFERLPMLFFTPLKLIIYITILFNFLGITFIFSFITLLLIVIGMLLFQGVRKKIEVESNIVKDARMKVTTELLNHLKFAKLFSWENEFMQRIFNERDKELVLIWKRSLLSSFTNSLFNCCPQIICLVAISTYYFIDGRIILSDIFLIINIFSHLQQPIVFLPFFAVILNDLNIGLKRIEKFLNQDEVDENFVKSKSLDSKISIEIKDGNFSWGLNENPLEKKGNKNQILEKPNSDTFKLTLKNINLKLKKGELLMIIGEVGSGKSSLIQAILNNLLVINDSKSKAEITVNGTVSYVSQSGWIRNNTLRENITFFNDFNIEKYEKVIKICELIHDLKMLPGGDLTEIGEKGINLSGGQKARVSIARAIYSESDIYLFDDPISALDAHVGEKIMKNCILEHLKGKSRILITHAIQYLNYADLIIVMRNGEIFWEGKYKDLINQEFYQEYVKNIKKKEKEAEAQVIEEYTHDNSKKTVDRITTNEEEESMMTNEVYSKYLGLYGKFFFLCLIILSFIILQLSQTFSEIWLTFWSKWQDIKDYPYLMIFFMSNMMYFLFVFIRMYLISTGNLNASKTIHQKMITNLVQAPINTYHDVIPKGRILNRLSKDLRDVDFKLVYNFSLFPLYMLRMIISIIICSVFVFSTLFLIPLFVYFLIKLTRLYVKASKDLNLIERINRSPIINIFTETVTGAITIRAYKYEKSFINLYMTKLSDLYIVNIFKNGISQWYSLVIQSLNILFFSIMIIFTFFFSKELGLTAQGIALILNSTLQLQLTITYFMTELTEIENNMIAADRCMKYFEIPSESASECETDKQLDNWPSQGKVYFKNYSVRYRPLTPLVLKDLTFTINPGERIGVVGRTGSGKSTLCLSLFRILEKDSGNIFIDDIEISKIGLKTLRSRITIIPQDPMMFEGTLRYNIDPLNQFKDDEIIEALNEVSLFSLLNNEKGINMNIQENGGNISVGERQLLSIARAILRKSKVVLLDEATANIDFKTEELIQKTIRKYFKNSTLITIAHRIQTIIDYDRILVLSDGKIIEFDTPKNLIENKNSHFFQLYSKSV